MKRFKEAVNKAWSVNGTKSLVHLKKSLDSYDCERYICKLMEKKPTTLARAYELDSHFIMETEAMWITKQMRNPSQQKPYFHKKISKDVCPKSSYG